MTNKLRFLDHGIPPYDSREEALDRISWFDEKYHSGTKLTLEDKAALFRDFPLPIHFNERAIVDIQRTVQTCLFKFEQTREYLPSMHLVLHNLLFCVYPLTSPDKNILGQYIQRYKAALKKHEGHVAFHLNFD